MAALVQSYPQQSGTVTVLQTRPSSASGMLQSVQGQPTGQYLPSGSHRNSIHGLPTTVTAPVVYRANSGPVQQYTFRSMPTLAPAAPWQQPRTHRTSSASAVPTIQTLDYLQPAQGRSRYAASMSMTNLPSTASPGLHAGVGTRDDSALSMPGARRSPRLTQASNAAASAQPLLAPAAPIRAAPERYRRSALRTADMASVNAQGSTATTDHQLRPSHSALLNRPNSFVGAMSDSAVDDLGVAASPSPDEMKRARRRSMPALDSPGFPMHLTPHDLKQPAETTSPNSAGIDSKAAKSGKSSTADKTSNDGQTAASGQSAGANLRPSSSANRSGNPADPTAGPTASHDQAGASSSNNPDSSAHLNAVSIPSRTSSTDAPNGSKQRLANPSPLSKPVTAEMEGEHRSRGPSSRSSDSASTEPAMATTAPDAVTTPRYESPAVKQLTALNQARGKARSKTSRLRRAFSFGSAAEFRKVVQDGSGETAAAAGGEPAHGGGKLHKERDPDEAYNEEQARIAQQQEAAGIGSSIYAGGRFFSGSTDNLSISSTASSASIMIRKMGRGMKKGTRSLVGLFRPKSIIGSPTAEVPHPETTAAATQAAVSMITVEAERERVNVDADPRAPGGSTGFPRLERNSIDAAKVQALEPERLGSSGTDSTAARKSIVGGEKERAEVLAAVRKGILKNRAGSSSPSPRSSETKGSAFELPSVPSVTDSPNSSAPSTPNEESQAAGGHRRTGTVTIGSEDYFVSALRLRQDSKGSPGTPQGAAAAAAKRNATFSPRIVFFETWPSQEYDRRGEIATCNRLTPMLAQQIKEELNSFKMEMEVHENSKIYTHFF